MYERIFNVLVVIAAVLVFSSLIGALTNAISHLQNLNSERIHDQSALRRYLCENKVPLNLVSQIWSTLKHSLKSSDRRCPEREVKMLSLLPKHLLHSLREEVYRPHLATHPFFDHYWNIDGAAMRHITANCVTFFPCDMEADLFTSGDVASRTYLVLTRSSFFYSPSHEGPSHFGRSLGRLSLPMKTQNIGKSDSHPRWICEAAIWLNWHHEGTLISKEYADLLVVDTEAFRSSLRCFMVADTVMMRYLRLFVKCVLEGRESPDTWFDEQVLDDIMFQAAEGLPLEMTLAEVRRAKKEMYRTSTTSDPERAMGVLRYSLSNIGSLPGLPRVSTW